VQLPGRERRLAEPAAQQMDSLVDQLLIKLVPLFDVPFALFGHSMGATIAFELARRLLCEHLIEPAHLFASSRPAPHYPRGRRIIHQLSDVELVSFVRRIGGDATGLLENPDTRAKMLDTLRADLALTETYIPPEGAVLACPITAFGGANEPLFRADYLESWRHCTTGAFDSRILEGDHFFFAPNPKPLISAIIERLTTDGKWCAS
jgi:surfactin synthase thioesterase subunit